MDGARRRRRRAARPGELIAGVGIVVAGLGLIAGIVLLDPRWQRIVASWRERATASAAAVATVLDASPSIEDSVAVGARLPAIRPEAPGLRPATPASRPPSRPESDSTQVMASLLVAQLGPDLAWRTAQANADAHTGDSPEHAYWSGVAALIRDGGIRPRP